MAGAWHRGVSTTSKGGDGWQVERTPQMYQAWMMGHSTERMRDEDEDDNTLTTGDDGSAVSCWAVTAASLQGRTHPAPQRYLRLSFLKSELAAEGGVLWLGRSFALLSFGLFF